MMTRCAVPSGFVRHGVCGLLSSNEIRQGSWLTRKHHRVSSSRLFSPAPAGATVTLAGACNARFFRSGVSSFGRKGELITGENFVEKAPKKKKETKAGKSKKFRPLAYEARAAKVDSPGAFKDGGIHLIIGPMFAGKSTTLLRRVQEEADLGRSVALVKSEKDTRYSNSAIVTHDGQQMPCYAVPDLATFKSKIGEKSYKELDVIGVDEAQFFPDLYEFCLYAADFEGKTLIVAGLDGDFLRRRFGSTLDLIPIADSVVKLSSRCEICSRPASFSFRKTLDIHAELVGGADIYMPVCRQHFVNGQTAVEIASRVIDAQKIPQTNKDS